MRLNDLFYRYDLSPVLLTAQEIDSSQLFCPHRLMNDDRRPTERSIIEPDGGGRYGRRRRFV